MSKKKNKPGSRKSDPSRSPEKAASAGAATPPARAAVESTTSPREMPPSTNRAGDGREPLLETPEPVAARGSFPVLLFVLLGLILFWGDMYLMENGADLMGKGGSFPAQVYHPYHRFTEVERMNPKSEGAAFFELGGVVYNRACVACHQANGKGASGQFPPLAGSEWVLTPSPDRVLWVILNGLQGPIEVLGAQYNNVMVPWRDTLTDEEIAAVATYIRNEWGNQASAVTAEQALSVRQASEGKAGTFTTADLKAIPE